MSGTVDADDIPGASLRVELQRLFHPGHLFMAPIVGYLGETRADGNGSYEFVLCFDDDDPWWIKVYVHSTDEVSGERSITVRDEQGWFPVYAYGKGLYNMEEICELEVSYVISGKWADAFIIATSYAHENRIFIESWTSLDPYGGTFPFYAYWPFYNFDNPPHYNASKCWHDCWINVMHARSFGLLTHEYGHHAHYAAGGLYSTQAFVEGWAIFHEAVAAEYGYVRGSAGGDRLESVTHTGEIAGTAAINGAAAYLWDLWDAANTEPADLLNCDPDVDDDTNVAFAHLLSEYADAVALSGDNGFTPGFYETYMPMTDNIRAISYNHNVTTDVLAQNACIIP